MAMSLPSALVSTVIFLSMGCGASPPEPNDSSKFVGKWTYQSGSTIAVDCPGMPEQTLDLSHALPSGQPGYFVVSESSPGVVHEVDARGCEYDWTVSGDVASGVPNASCATFPDGRGGNRVVHMQSGTKRTADGATMQVDVQFATDPTPVVCAIAVRGTARKP
jgi:hypothetical protein